MPQSAFPTHYTRLVARTAGDPRQFEHAIVAAVRDVDPTQGVFHVQPMEEYVASALAERRFALGVIALFGFVALVLSGIASTARLHSRLCSARRKSASAAYWVPSAATS